MILAETSKIAVPSRRNAYFQEIEDPPKLTIQLKFDNKLSVFWDIGFGRILGGFGEGFGRPKSLIFQNFRCFFEANFEAYFEELQKRFKDGLRDFGPWSFGPGVSLGGRGE